jgi:hypothetical protein
MLCDMGRCGARQVCADVGDGYDMCSWSMVYRGTRIAMQTSVSSV